MTVKPRILVVEAETAVAMMMVHLLTRAGCGVEVVTTVKKGMRLAQKEEFDLITLDVDLPGASGFEICSRLKQNPRLQDTPVVFVSGHPCEEARLRAFDLGAVDYIIKPFDPTDFIFRIMCHAKERAMA